jgi:putative oxidoreductase
MPELLELTRKGSTVNAIIRSSAFADLRARIERVVGRLEAFPLWLLQFIFRFSIGSVFWQAGLTKIESWQTTIVLFREEYKVPVLPPELAAYLATGIEMVCPILLTLGLGARFATLPMLAQTVVIEVFVYPEDWIEHLTWAAMLLLIMTRGAGVLSIDHLVARKLSTERGDR